MKKHIALFLLILSIFSACKTDFELNDTWKETTVVYGLLNKSKAIQLVKINKGFLGTGDANQYAQTPDSINYDPKKLEVYLFEKLNGTTTKSILLKDSIIAGKKPGDFSAAKNIIYFTNEKLKSNYQYEINVKNLSSGNICKSTTPIIDTIKAYSFSLISGYVGFVISNSTTTSKGTYRSPKVSWLSSANAKTYQLNVRFYYHEKNVSTSLIENKYVDWLQPALESTTTAGGTTMSQTLSGEAFYQYIGSSIELSSDVKRYADSLEVFITMGSEELANYITINTPSSDLNQDKPIYTNIENGIGLFSTRYNASMVRYICSSFPTPTAPSPLICNQTVESYQEFVEGKYTSKLSFDYP